MGGHKPVAVWPADTDYSFDVYADAIPLRVEDLTDPAWTDWSTEEREKASPLVRSTEYRQWALTHDRVPELEYRVVEPRLPALYGTCRKALLAEREDEWADGELVLVNHYRPADPVLWGAEEAWQAWFGSVAQAESRPSWLLAYPGRLVELRLRDWPAELTPEQMALVGERLGTGAE